MRYVIIGGGIAGTTAAEELRKAEPEATITLVSEEQHPIYSRVLLPHFMKAKVPRERVFLKKDGWYEEQQIEWLPGVTVDELDPVNKFVRVSTGQEYEYDKVLVATGGDVRTIPEDIRGVTYFRTLDDADHIMQLLSERPEGGRGMVYGGGFISCEYINFFEKYGVPTSIAFRGDHFWNGIFDAESGALVNKKMIDGGIEVIPNASAIELVGEKELEAVKIGERTVPCWMLGIGIGMVRDTEWLEKAGLTIGRGVACNEFLESGIPDVYVAGDCAEFMDTIVGRSMYVGNWMNAMMQGRVVAKNMRGERTPFQLVSSYATNVLGLEIIFVGDVETSAAEEVIIRGSAEEGGVTQIFLRGGRVVGGTMVGRNADRTPVTKLIQSKEDVSARKAAWKDPLAPIV